MKIDKQKLENIYFPVHDLALLSTLDKELHAFNVARDNGWCSIGNKRDKQNLQRLIKLYESEKPHQMYHAYMRLSEGCKESLCNMSINFSEYSKRISVYSFKGNERIFYESANIITNCKANKRNHSFFRSISNIWSYINYKYPCENRTQHDQFILEIVSLLPIDDLDNVLRSLRRYKNK